MDKQLDKFSYSTVIHVPRSLLWDVFEEAPPVACILTFFHQYTQAHAVDQGIDRVITFLDDCDQLVEGHVWRHVTSHSQSELGTKFTTAQWGSINVHMKLRDRDRDQEQTDSEFLIDVAGMHDEAKKADFLQSLAARYEKCVYYILLRATRRHGCSMKFSIQINCPREIIWRDIGDWGCVEWVKGATHVTLMGDGKRKVFAGPNKHVINMKVSQSEDTLVYEILTPDLFKCVFYRGILSCRTSGSHPRATNIYYKNLWLPLHLRETAQVREMFRKMFNERFGWMKKKYEAKANDFFEQKPVEVYLLPAEDQMPKDLDVHEDSGVSQDLDSKPPPPMTGKNKQQIRTTILASPETIWEIIKDFGVGCEKWWLNSKFQGFENDDEGNQCIGCIRTLTRDNLTVRDKLIHLNDSDYKLMFETIEFNPNPYGFVNYSVLVEVEGSEDAPEDESNVIVTLGYDCLPVLRPVIAQQQRDFIMGCFDKLSAQFSPIVGQIEVTLVKGEDLGLDQNGSSDLYCTICVNNSSVIQSSTKYGTTNPKWNEEYSFDVTNASTNLSIAVWDRNEDAEDSVLGVVNFALPNFAKTPDTKYKVPLSTGFLYVKSRFHTDLREPQKGATKNTVVAQLNFLRDTVTNVYLELPLLRLDTFQWKAPKRMKEYPGVPLENLPGFCENVPHQERISPGKMGPLLGELSVCTASYRGHVQGKEDKESRIEHAYCKYLTPPSDPMGDYANDNIFCQRFFNGFAPNLVKCVKRLKEIPEKLRQIYFEDNLKVKIEEKEIFLVEFEAFRKLEYDAPGPRYSPFLLFQGKRTEGFSILGISMSKNDPTIYTPHSNAAVFNGAKLFLNSVTLIHHLMVNVFLRNMILESVCFCLHKNLVEKHPVRRILLPYLSEIAHKSSFLRKLFLDHQSKFLDHFALIGKANCLEVAAKLAKKPETVAKFLEPLKDFENRGFDFACTSYLYQADTIQLWQVLRKHVSKYVGRIYQIDRDVESDSKVQAFYADLVDAQCGNLALANGLHNKSQLTDFITGVIFAATAQSSAFEKCLYTEASLTSGVCSMIKKHMPAPKDHHKLTSANIFDTFFPPNDDVFIQIMLTKVLSTDSSQSLAEIESVLGHKFTDDLCTLSTQIKERNSKVNPVKGFQPYSKLDPFNIPSVAGL